MRFRHRYVVYRDQAARSCAIEHEFVKQQESRGQASPVA